MIPTHDAELASRTAHDVELAKMRLRPITPGLRVVCQFCSRDLPHSDKLGTRTSHGQCCPPCPQTPLEWAALVNEAMKTLTE